MTFFAWLMFRLTSHWKQFRISGSSRIGNDLPVQAHPALDNSTPCMIGSSFLKSAGYEVADGAAHRVPDPGPRQGVFVRCPSRTPPINSLPWEPARHLEIRAEHGLAGQRDSYNPDHGIVADLLGILQVHSARFAPEVYDSRMAPFHAATFRPGWECKRNALLSAGFDLDWTIQ